jgi:hypothetical protein
MDEGRADERGRVVDEPGASAARPPVGGHERMSEGE